MKEKTRRFYLDNSELLSAAECLESYAQALDDDGEPDAAGAARDTAETMRHIAFQAQGGKPVRNAAGLLLPTIEIMVRATVEVEDV